MSYTKEGIVASFPLGIFPVLPVQTGWSFYPIVYKDKRYVVDVHSDCSHHLRSGLSRPHFVMTTQVRVLVFELKEKREPFGGTKELCCMLVRQKLFLWIKMHLSI